MKNRLAIVVVAFCMGLGACTTAGGTPATAPEATTPVVMTTEPASTTTAVLPATNTTLDRVAEIEAIFQALEVRRLQAIMDQDEEAFRAVFANEEYAERSVGGMGLVTVIDPAAASMRVVDVFADEPTCIAAGVVADGTAAIDGGVVLSQSDYIAEDIGDGWGLSWIGSGWRCDGPHPFSE